MNEKDKLNTEEGDLTLSRRNFFRLGAGLGALALTGRSAFVGADEGNIELPFANGTRPLVAYPQKRPLMVHTARGVNLETPFHVFNEGVFTPNDAFFVRWSSSAMPTQIDTVNYRVNVRGRVKKQISFSIDDLKKLPAMEIAAVCQCAGNSRGFSMPRVPGGQWGNGAMGNAKWTGVRLKDVLDQAGLEADATRVRFNGLEKPSAPSVPDVIKSLDMDMALSPDVFIAYAMNGEPLPVLNGFPVRLVVPGWYATYWVKMLEDIEVLNSEDESYFMKSTYRIPANACGCVEPGQKSAKTVPITRFTIRSFITSLQDGHQVKGGEPHTVKGIAFDSGFGIQRVLFSSDGGRQWHEATLGKDYGKYSFREWQIPFTPARGQAYGLMVMAVNTIGESQASTPLWNPSGYSRNIIETVNVKAV